jgi:hypothetical protein
VVAELPEAAGARGARSRPELISSAALAAADRPPMRQTRLSYVQQAGAPDVASDIAGMDLIEARSHEVPRPVELLYA